MRRRLIHTQSTDDMKHKASNDTVGRTPRERSLATHTQTHGARQQKTLSVGHRDELNFKRQHRVRRNSSWQSVKERSTKRSDDPCNPCQNTVMNPQWPSVLLHLFIYIIINHLMTTAAVCIWQLYYLPPCIVSSLISTRSKRILSLKTFLAVCPIRLNHYLGLFTDRHCQQCLVPLKTTSDSLVSQQLQGRMSVSRNGIW